MHFLCPRLQGIVGIFLNVFLLLLRAWIFARTLIQEGIIQSPKAGSFITTVLIIIGAGLIIFFLFDFFLIASENLSRPLASGKGAGL
jgi:hypothetical protein